MEPVNSVPRHVAVIMDGNRRWAKKRLLPAGAGHRAGLKRMIPLVEHMFERGVKCVTLYALSTENLNRSEEEVNGLFSLFRTYFSENAQRLYESGIRLSVIGERELLPEDIQTLILNWEEKTKEGQKGRLLLAIAYGARTEILKAAQRAEGKLLSEEEFSSLLYTGGVPAPDLLIRTGNEQRLSNFLLWQSAYTELYFSKKMFPEFSNGDFDKALKEYAARDRRFGKK